MSEEIKIYRDALASGIGISFDGKHVPLDAFYKQPVDYKARAEAAEARVKVLEEALRPFAYCGNTEITEWHDSVTCAKCRAVQVMKE